MVMRKSGRYPWGGKPINVIEVDIPCEICGKVHKEESVDGHISQPHWCKDCWKKVMDETEKELEKT